MGNRIFMSMDEIGLCNCISCGAECVGEKTQNRLSEIPSIFWPEKVKRMPTVAERSSGRPICSSCAAAQRAQQETADAEEPGLVNGNGHG
jgi:hypothetical protein